MYGWVEWRIEEIGKQWKKKKERVTENGSVVVGEEEVSQVLVVLR